MFGKFFLISTAAGLMVVSAFAQGPRPFHDRGAGDFAMVRAEFGISNKLVTGAPYSAQAVTQFTQTLANGDHVQRTTSAAVARDSQGRTRVDRSIAAVGALAASGGERRAIVIQDPVAGMSYALDPASRTARSMHIRAPHPGTTPEDRPNARAARSQANLKTEDLGTQTIQGVSAQGKRVTRVIPAGQEGNEKEIDIVTETWYSPDLQMLVMSKTSDPLYGDVNYQLNSISRTEPDPALFTVPSDYAIEQGRPMGRGAHFRGGPPPAQ